MVAKKKSIEKKKTVKKKEKRFCSHSSCNAINKVHNALNGLTFAEGFAVLEIVRHELHRRSDAKDVEGALKSLFSKK